MNYTSIKDYGDLTLVELKFEEMHREVENINTIVNDVKSNLEELINAINKLAGLVGISTIPITSSTKKIDIQFKKIEDFVNKQISRYSEINEFTSEQIKELISLLEQLFDEDGQLITYEINGKKVTENFTDLLKAKENEAVLTNRYAKGYRVTDNKDLNSNISQEGWENLETIYTYFMKKGLTDEQISGILANAAGESWFDADAKNPTSTAKGLFQWLDNRYPESWDIESQLDHAWDEMENVLIYNGKTTLSRIQNCTTPEEASNVFLEYFGGAGSENYKNNPEFASLYPKRRTFAKSFYNYIQKMKAESTY
mgnify:FL=1